VAPLALRDLCDKIRSTRGGHLILRQKPRVVGGSISRAKFLEHLEIVVADQRTATIRDTCTKEFETHDRAAACAVFRPDGKEFFSAEVTAGPHAFSRVGVGAAEDVGEQLLPPKKEVVLCLAYSPDGTDILMGTVAGNVHVIEIATGKVKRTIAVNDKSKLVISLHLVNNGKTLITHSNSVIQYWNLATGKELKRLTDSGDAEMNYLAVSGDGKTMVSQSGKQVTVWDVEKMAARATFTTGWKYCGAISPDGSLIALGFDGGLYTFDGSGKVIRGWGGEGVDVKAIAFSPDGKLCAIGLTEGRMILFDANALAVADEH